MSPTTPPPKTKTKSAREYLRVSLDRSHRARSVDEQHTDNTRTATDNGWTLAEPYRDVDRSASRYAKRDREGYDRLVADLEHDQFGADVLILWEHSRGSRRVSEWVILLELLEQRGVKVHVTTHARTYDPANPRDRRSLLEDSVDSEYESSKISTRVKRAMADNAASGRPHGRVPFGYQRRRWFDGNRRMFTQEPDTTTAPLVRELFDRVKGGHSIRSIATDWKARGIVNGKGTPFTPAHLRDLLGNVAYIGQRTHRGAVLDGDWEPLVDRATFLSVQHILAAPERRTSRPGRGVHLLSMIAKCAVCDGPLAATTRSKETGEYQCHRASHVRIDKAELDAFAEQAILAYLNSKDVRKARAAAADNSTEVVKARDDVAAITAELDDLVEQVSSGALSATFAAKVEPGLLARLAAAVAHKEELETPSKLRGLFPPGTDWSTMPMAAKREVARIVLAPDMLGDLRVTRRPREAGPRHVPVRDRVEWKKA